MKRILENKKILIVIIVFVSRLPFIFNSLGCDYDIWREIFSGKILHEEHVYNVSRFPGYPFSEILYSFIYQFPYWFLNLVSVFFTAGSALVFYLLLIEKNIKNAFLLSVAFSFVPIIFINSTISIDYNFSLFFILCATYFIVKKRYLVSSLFFGLVVCSRFNNIIFLVPFIYLVFSQSESKKEALKFALKSLFFSILLFFPVIIRYHGKFLYHYGTEAASLKTYVSFSTLYIYGLLGIVAIFLIFVKILIFDRKSLQRNFFGLKRDYFYVFCFIFVAINFLFFLKFPLEPGYLIPSVPFVLVVFAKIFDEKSIKLLSFSLILSPFFFYINAKKIEWKGVAFVNEETENQQLHFTHSFISEINKLPTNSVVCVANMYEHLILIKGENGYKNDKIFKLLSEKELIDLKRKNIEIFYTDEANERTKEEYGFELKKYGKSISKNLEFNR